MKKSFAAAGLLALAFTATAHAGPNDNADVRSQTLALAQGTVDFAFDNDARKHPFLIQSKRALTAMVSRLTHANQTERAQIHKDAYALRLTLERRDFAYHYAMAAHTVAMAASNGTDEATFDKTDSAMYATAIYDLGRITRKDLRRPLSDLSAEAKARNVTANCSGKWCLLDALAEDDIHNAVEKIRTRAQSLRP